MVALDASPATAAARECPQRASERILGADLPAALALQAASGVPLPRQNPIYRAEWLTSGPGPRHQAPCQHTQAHMVWSAPQFPAGSGRTAAALTVWGKPREPKTFIECSTTEEVGQALAQNLAIITMPRGRPS